MPVQPVLDSTIHYREAGARAGVPVVFLHGNPTSSHLWREVLSALGGAPARLLAPDLIGMGESGKPAVGYTFDDHARYLDAWFDALGLDDAVLVGHDWGGALAFDRAARYPERVRGIAFTETIVKAMSWEEFPEGGRELFRAIKTPGVGEAMLLDANGFVEGLSGSGVRPMDPRDLDVYRAPYPTRESRRPPLQWARSMPLGGEPAEVVARVAAYGEWLAGSPATPKLLLTFAPWPGAMTGPEAVEWCAAHIAGLELARHDDVPAGHHTPEDHPLLVAAAVADWAERHRLWW
ncbi:haloalkane dehalogenase [Streptomyces sp. NPDC002104]